MRRMIGNRSRTVHGHRTTGYTSPTYRSWRSMIERCESESKDSYEWYGAKGVKVCAGWRHSFAKFLEDMGERPLGHTLDRKNNNKDYEPGNCLWSTIQVQNRNRSVNVFIEHEELRLCVADWSRRLGIPPPTISRRLKRGLPIPQVLAVKESSNTNK